MASPVLERELEKAYALDADWILLDFRRLAFMDSTGLHLLVKAQQRAEEAGRRLALTRGGEQVQRLLDLTGVADLVRIVESPEQLLETTARPTVLEPIRIRRRRQYRARSSSRSRSCPRRRGPWRLRPAGGGSC